MKYLPLVLTISVVLGVGLTAPSLYAQADLPFVLQDLHNTSAKIGITQNQVGSTSTMELLTSDGDGDLATRLLLRGGSDFQNIEFYRGARGSETLSMMVRGIDGRVGIGTNAPSSLLHVEGDIQAGSTTQTGAIRTYRSGFAQEVGLLSGNGFGGTFYLYDEAGNRYSYLEPDIDGTGGFFGVSRSAATDGFWVDGNYLGTDDTRVTLFGTSFMTFNASRTGDASVQLPSDAVSSAEILDETGATQGINGLGTLLSGGLEILESSTITAPTAGFVLAVSSGQIDAFHNSGTDDDAIVGVSGDCDTTPTLDSDQDNEFRIPSGASTGTWTMPWSAQKIFPVTAGAATFCIVANETSGDVGIADRSLSLVFIPTTYGTVDQTQPGASGPTGNDYAIGTGGGLTATEIAQEQAASQAANRARIDRELAQVQALRAELERYLEQVKQEQGHEDPSGGDR